MKQVFFELKLMGINAVWIFISLVSVFILIAYLGGELLNLSYIGFEVIFPFMVAIVVGEWGKTKADVNFDVIAAQSKSLFRWVVLRFTTVFVTGTLFAFIGMTIVYIIRNEMPVWELLLLYFPPAFFLSSVCALCGICFSGEHIATLIGGILWILTMLARSLLRIPGVEYIYMFIRYAGDVNGIWITNKFLLTLFGLLLWMVIFALSKKRVFVK